MVRKQRSKKAEIGVRWVLPGVVLLAGIIVVALNPTLNGAEGWAMLTGAGLSIVLLNVLYRIGVQGDEERDREEEARVFLDEHGYWPDEEPRPRIKRERS